MQEIADGCPILDVFLASKVGSQNPKTSPSDNVILSAAKALRLPLSHFARTENLVIRQCHSERSEGSAVIVEDSRDTRIRGLSKTFLPLPLSYLLQKPKTSHQAMSS
jgi:hypothetical protein